MKSLLLVLVLALSYTASAQWEYQTVENGLDDPYKIAYCQSIGSLLPSLIKLELLDNGQLAFYIQSVFICEEEPIIEMAFLINGKYSKYSEYGSTSSDNTTVFINNNLMHETMHDFVNYFKSCSSLKLRITDTDCGSETYDFNMKNSTAALEFMLK